MNVEATAEVTNAEKIQRLWYSVASGAANSISAQLTFFGPPFVLMLSELGIDKAQIGFLFSLFPFTGMVALLAAPAAARIGNKRTYVVSWAIRYVFAAGLLLIPWLLPRLGTAGIALYISGLVLAFALFRSLGETGYYPWSQEFVPNAIRGQYYAAYQLFATLAAFLSITVASYVVGHGTGLGRYMGIIAAGVVAGAITVWLATRMPGGAPQRNAPGAASNQPGALAVLADRNFALYLIAAALVILGSQPLANFLPLFLRDEVGLAEGTVVLLQAANLLGGLVSSYLWGWFADRYGSKPVIFVNVALNAALPLGWLLLPAGGPVSLPAAAILAFVTGAALVGWSIASSRLLYGYVIPQAARTRYTSIHYAWIGIVGGAGPLLAGWLLNSGGAIHGRLWFLTINPYTVLLAASLLLSAAALPFFHRLHGDEKITFTKFAAMFFRGNPLVAFESSIRYRRAAGEMAGIALAERMGQARSPLNVDELVEALADPRYNVRLEAIISAAHSAGDARLSAALIDVLREDEPAVRALAAWALGRMRSPAAFDPLCQALTSEVAEVRTQSARALAFLGNRDAAPALIERLRSAGSPEERVAFAAALGALHATEAAADVLALLRRLENPRFRMEAALALARMISTEHYFIRLWRDTHGRETHDEPGTALAQALLALRRRARGLAAEGDAVGERLAACAECFAAGDLAQGAENLAGLARAIPVERLDVTAALVLGECADRLEEYGPARFEYLLLALHVLDVALA